MIPSSGTTPTHDVVSPVSGRVLWRVPLSDRNDILAQLAAISEDPLEIETEEVFACLGRLRREIHSRSTVISKIMMMETGFIVRDCRDTLDGALEFLGDFETHCRDISNVGPVIPHSYSGQNGRSMRILFRPVRSVAAVVPQNASLGLALIVIASALRIGARAIVRPSLQCATSGEILAEIIQASGFPAGSVLVLNSLASDFLEACYASPRVQLIHYIGSNRYGADVLKDSFQSGKTCLIDGQGNGLLYVDASFPREEAIRLITTGVTRFNGETCTSVNGILVEKSIYDSLRDDLVSAFRTLRVGDPSEASTDVGPLFSPGQAEALEGALAGTRRLCGGRREGAYFSPALVEGIEPGHPLAREGLFGPAAWIQPADESEAIEWIRANTFPLSDTLLSRRPSSIRRFAMESQAPRICVNEDPTLESMFEPWGGYPPSGMNPVSLWLEKYRQPFQIDATKDVDLSPLLKAN